MKQPHLDVLEAQLRTIGEIQGGDALRILLGTFCFAAASVIASTSGISGLSRCENSLPEALLQGGIAKAYDLPSIRSVAALGAGLRLYVSLSLRRPLAALTGQKITPPTLYHHAKESI